MRLVKCAAKEEAEEGGGGTISGRGAREEDQQTFERTNGEQAHAERPNLPAFKENTDTAMKPATMHTRTPTL